MAVSDRGQKIYDIDSNSFNNIHLKKYIKTYFKDGSLNISTDIPVLILESGSDWIDICLSSKHPLYILFRELSKDNENLYTCYFKERYSSKTKDHIKLRVNYENIDRVTQFCKLDTKVRIVFKEGLFLETESDPQYFSEWKFLLDLNKIEFM